MVTRRRALASFVLRRLLWAVPVFLSVIVITFSLMHMVPGSPWNAGDAQGGEGVQLSDAAIRQLDAKYGLDEPWLEQLVLYLRNVVLFDLGTSYHYPGQQAADLVLDALPQTLALGAIAITVITPIGVGLGVIAGLRHNSRVDYAVSAFATLGASIPNFVVGIFLILFLSVGLHRMTDGEYALPATGFGFDEHLILPVVTLGLLPTAFLARLTRSGVLEVRRQDYVRTAQAKGLGERAVVTRHVLKNAIVPVVTTLGPLFALLVTGTVVIESLFLIPGLGATFVQAVTHRDYPVILSATIVFTFIIVIANLLVDMLYLLVDPRMRPS
jgi:oligopeptide transport system permease protein